MKLFELRLLLQSLFGWVCLIDFAEPSRDDLVLLFFRAESFLSIGGVTLDALVTRLSLSIFDYWSSIRDC